MANENNLATHIKIVRNALKTLSLSSKDTPYSGTVNYHYFTDPLSNSEVQLLTDIDRPSGKEMSAYILKHMEYIQTFLVADRLGKEIGISPHEQ